MATRILKHTPLLVTIDLPSDWEQEVEEESTDVFWNDSAEGGTLRIAVLVYEADSDVTEEDLREVVEAEEESEPIQLPGGGYMSSSEDDSEEDEVAIHNWTWTLSKAVEGNRVAVVVCTYTVETAILPLPEVREEIALVKQAVTNLVVETR